MDTEITKLRNMMSPIVNYFSILKKVEGMIDSPIEFNEGYYDKLYSLMNADKKKAIELMSEITRIIKSIPDAACEGNTSEREKVNEILPLVSGSDICPRTEHNCGTCPDWPCY